MARAPVLQDIEAPPEADRLEDFPHPRDTARLFGHAQAEAVIAQTFSQDRVHHAWLVNGREGIGKATLAYRMARFLLAAADQRGVGEHGPLSVPQDCAAARQVRALSHPGLMVIRRAWEPKTKRFLSSISVDDVRRLKGFLAHAAGPGAWRVVIVDQADELNANAANAVLKSLEEPPARTIFILLSSEPGRLLTTIRSRCRRFDLTPLSEPDLRQAADQALAAADRPPITAEAWPKLAGLARGSVRRLLVLTGSEGLGLHEKVTTLLSLLPKVDWLAVHAIGDEVSGSGNEQRFEQFFDLLMDRLATLIRARATAAAGPEDDTAARRLIPDHALATWAELWETAQTRKAETLALNLDRKTLILELVARMQAASRH